MPTWFHNIANSSSVYLYAIVVVAAETLYTLVECPGGLGNFNVPVGIGTLAPCATPKLAQSADKVTREIDNAIMLHNAFKIYGKNLYATV